MANKIYHISIQAAPRLRLTTGATVFFTTTLTSKGEYPRSIVCYLDFLQSGRAPSGDFADLGANIDIPLQEQLW